MEDTNDIERPVDRRPFQPIVLPSVVSFGGGVNSTALLIGMHERGQRPDAILFSDTGGERPTTYEHIEAMKAWCVMAGFPELTTVRYHESAHGTLEQECLNNETLPSKAFGFGGCSVKWKRAPMDRWVAAWPQAVAAGRGRMGTRRTSSTPDWIARGRDEAGQDS